MKLPRISMQLIGLVLFLISAYTDSKAFTRISSADSIPAKEERNPSQIAAEKDTIKALENLFKRKRRFGFLKTIVFGSAALYAVNHTLHPSEASNNKGWQKDIEEDATIFTICAGTMGVVNGTIQTFRYSKITLQRIIEDRRHGIPYPKELTNKLRPSDFR